MDPRRPRRTDDDALGATDPAAPLAALPERARLLHIGVMKTGTTALQRAASRRRGHLLRHGVRYPGQQYNHRQAALALMNRPVTTGAAHRDSWSELMEEVAHDQRRRIWISNEFICGSDEPTARRFLDDLIPEVHVVVTVRSVGSVLPSLWQQYVKAGSTQDFQDFLVAVLAPVGSTTLPPHYRRHDQGEVVSRWAALAGPENLTVVVVDKTRPRVARDVFERLLGLPSGLLDPPAQRGVDTNRTLSAEEASLFLAVNRAIPEGAVERDDLVRIVQSGALARVINERARVTTDSALALPPWAGDGVAQLGQRYAAAIAATGVRVVGDLADLSRVPVHQGVWEPCRDIPVELAVEAVVGALSAGLHRGSDFGTVRAPIVRAGRPRNRRSTLRRLVRRVRRSITTEPSPGFPKR